MKLKIIKDIPQFECCEYKNRGKIPRVLIAAGKEIELKENGINIIAGSNGSGKTTLLKSLIQQDERMYDKALHDAYQPNLRFKHLQDCIHIQSEAKIKLFWRFVREQDPQGIIMAWSASDAMANDIMVAPHASAGETILAILGLLKKRIIKHAQEYPEDKIILCLDEIDKNLDMWQQGYLLPFLYDLTNYSTILLISHRTDYFFINKAFNIDMWQWATYHEMIKFYEENYKDLMKKRTT